jgi:hypothetical protein
MAVTGGIVVTTDLISDEWLIGVCVVYAAAAWMLQMYRVVPPRDWLLERIQDLRTRSAAEAWKAESTIHENLNWLEGKVDGAGLLLPTSRVQMGWRLVHSIEDKHLQELEADLVDEQLRTLKCQLATMSGSEAKCVVKRIDDELKKDEAKKDDHGLINVDRGRRKALLQEVSIFRHNAMDRDYEDAAALLAKAVLVAVLAAAIVAGLGVLFDRESFFLFGAAGALVSRLTRVLRRRPKADDYGASWSTLIISPIGGALVGWVAVAIVAALANKPFEVLGTEFSSIWDDATSLLAFAVAFVAGFSERWFTRLVGTAESQLVGKLPTDSDSTTTEE